MNYCKSCKYYKAIPFTKPKCTRISNYHVVKKKEIPFTLEESFKICTGYFFSDKSSDNDKKSPSSGH